jgi:hypothetical protein
MALERQRDLGKSPKIGCWGPEGHDMRGESGGVGYDHFGYGAYCMFKTVRGYDVVVKEHWFSMAVNSTVNTRQTASLLNLLKPRSNLEVRANVFSVRVVDV